MKKMFKKILAGVMAALMVAGTINIPAKTVEAAGEPVFTARFEDKDGNVVEQAQPGDELKLILSVSNADTLSSFQVEMLFDKSKLIEVAQGNWSQAYSEYYMKMFMAGKFTFVSECNGGYEHGLVAVHTSTQKAEYATTPIPPMGDIDIAETTVTVSDSFTGEIPVSVDLISYAENGSDKGVILNPPVRKQTTLTVKEQPVPATAITLNQSELALDLSGTKTAQLSIASFEPENTTDKNNTVTWTSSDENIATVDESGNVTAVGKGTANITASITNANGDPITSNACKVTVSKSVTSITLDAETMALKQGQSKKLTATVLPPDADDTTVTWTSSDENVATVDNDGNVTATAESGSATITATAGGKSAACEVTVKTVHLESIELKETTELAQGTNEQLTVTYTPGKNEVTDELTDEKWTTSDESVATVDKDGNVSAVGAGKATITCTVTAEGKEFTKSCEVTVYVPVESIILTGAPTGDLLKGESVTLGTSLEPANADRYNLQWVVDSENVKLVPSADGKSCEVIGVSEGQATVKVTDELSGKTAAISVTVKEIKINEVKINVDKTELNKGESVQASATVLPETTTDTDKTVTWTSSDTSVATVDANGKITAVGGGKAVITAKSNARPEVLKTVEITVNVPLESISIGEETLELLKGQTSDLEVTYTPEDTTVDKTGLTWTSSDEFVATVDEKGTVTALKAGDATITAELDGKKAERKVEVTEIPLTGIALSETNKTIDKAEGSFDISVLLNEEETTDKITSAEWTTSDKTVVTVGGNEEKATVTLVGAGDARVTLTVTTDAGKTYTATCDVKVIIPLTGVAISKDGADVTGNTLSLLKGNTITLSAAPVPADTTDDTKVTWTSSNPEAVSVTADGVVTTIKESEEPVTITAQMGSKSAVVKIVAEEIHIDSIALNKTELKLDAKGHTAPVSEQLTVTYLPEDTTDAKEIQTWSSSDPTVATVEDGIVTALKGGNTTITAVTANGKIAKCEVSVEKHIDSITLNAEADTIKRNGTTKVTAVINPADATVDTTLTYAVDDASVLDISRLADEGIVTGLKEGTAVITATAANAPGTPSATYTVKVTEDHATLDDFTFADGEDGTHAIRVDAKNPKIEVKYDSADFTDDVVDITYEVDNSDVVEVDAEGNLTLLAREGKADVTVTITVRDGAGNESQLVKIYSLELVEIPVEKIALEQDIKMTEGSSKTLKAVFTPADTTNKKLEWKSSDPSIATVTAGEDGQAVVKALKAGKVTITATTLEGEEELTAETTITVTAKATGDGSQDGQNTSNQDKSESGSVQTGDNAPIAASVLSALLSLALIVFIILRRNKKAY